MISLCSRHKVTIKHIDVFVLFFVYFYYIMITIGPDLCAVNKIGNNLVKNKVHLQAISPKVTLLIE